VLRTPAMFKCAEAPSAQRERHPRLLGEGRLRRETVEGFPLFMGAEARARSASGACYARPVAGLFDLSGM
jgi:hypothetical protein